MKYSKRILLVIALFAVAMFADFGLISSEAFAQGGGRGGRGGRGRGAQFFQGPGEGGGEQAQQAQQGTGNNQGGNPGGSIFSRGNRGQRGQRGRGEGGQGNEEQPNNNRGPGARGPAGNPTVTPGQSLDPAAIARQTFERLDVNKDGMLQADEQRGLRGMGASADTNRDGVITLAELEASFSNPGAAAQPGGPGGPGGRRGGPRGEQANSSENSDGSPEERGRRGGGRRGRGGEENNEENSGPPRGQGGGGDGQQQRNPQAARQNADKKDAQMAKTLTPTTTEKSYRFKPAKDQMPKEAPAWFTTLLAKDANRDGQVDMSEYSSNWTQSTVRDFSQRDKDGDGIITLDDAMTK